MSIAVRRLSLWMVALSVAVVCGGATLSTFGAGVAAAAGCENEAHRTGLSAQLPDCRAYEQVSPQNKGGFAAYPLDIGLPAQVAPDGEAVVYLGYSAFPGASGNTALAAAHLASRTSGSWQTTELTPPVPATDEALQQDIVGYAFSEDLTESIVKVARSELTPGVTPGAYNLFLRRPDGSYSLLNTLQPRVPVEDECPSFLAAICFLVFDTTSFAGASSDYSHVLLESVSAFTPEAPEEVESLYESYGGNVRLAGILPDGNPADGSTAGSGSSVSYLGISDGHLDGSVEHAISEDGSHIVFQATADGGKPDPAQGGQTEVYDRIDGAETLELSAPAPGVEEAVTAEPATFRGASANGSRVFFSSSAELTAESKTEPAKSSEDLYEYDFDRAEPLKDLTVDTNPVDAASGAMVQGVTGISKNGEYVYFVADGELIPGQGADGQPNLYVEHVAP